MLNVNIVCKKKKIIPFQNYSMLLTYMDNMLKCDWLFGKLKLGHWLLENVSEVDNFRSSSFKV